MIFVKQCQGDAIQLQLHPINNNVICFFYKISCNIFILCHYSGTIVHDVNNNITYNADNSLLLNSNLCMLCVEMKETTCHELSWNYNDIDVEIA